MDHDNIFLNACAHLAATTMWLAHIENSRFCRDTKVSDHSTTIEHTNKDNPNYCNMNLGRSSNVIEGFIG
jgi:hypothetical protein